MIQTLKSWYHFLVASFWAFYFGYPGKKLTVIGVTGTDGKTTTTSIIYHEKSRNKSFDDNIRPCSHRRDTV
jgi:UDP-N-acetylmuramyl pentapeptide synthase